MSVRHGSNMIKVQSVESNSAATFFPNFCTFLISHHSLTSTKREEEGTNADERRFCVLFSAVAEELWSLRSKEKGKVSFVQDWNIILYPLSPLRRRRHHHHREEEEEEENDNKRSS